MKSIRWRLLGALLLVWTGATFAQEFKLETVKFRVTEDMVYGHKDGLALTYDALIPETKAKGLGVLILASGSWKSKKSLPAEEAKLRSQHWIQGLLNGGFTVFVVRHGSSPRYFVPEMIGDVQRAVRFIRLHAKEYGIDPQRIGLTGGSSGGHLSLMAALQADDGKPDSKDEVERVSSRVQALVTWFPPTDIVNFGAENGYKLMQTTRPQLFTDIFGKITDLETQLKAISPINFATASAPPVLLIHGDADKTVPVQQAYLLKAKYEALKRPIQVIIQPGGGHTYWLGLEKNYPTVWEWFDRYLK
jgi:acetyl esterase/lipase